MEPHPTQITTLILLLGIAQSNEALSNRLAQVGTGEGKSIVLAGLSCYLALVGFKVRCACYSSYLSSRDQENFKSLFEKLGVENSIKYGTFNDTCE
jgi:preprotein translocase subunit SecA